MDLSHASSAPSGVVAPDVADLVIIGSGFAGLTAAIAAADKGLKAVIVEASEHVGGGSTGSFGGVWIGDNAMTRKADADDSEDACLAYLTYVAAGQAAPDRMAAFVSNAARALEFYRRAGVALGPAEVNDHFMGRTPHARATGRSFEVEPFSGHRLGVWRERLLPPSGQGWRLPFAKLVRMSPSEIPHAVEHAKEEDMLCQGVGLVANALGCTLDRGVPILTSSPVRALMQDGGRTTGVVLADGRSIQARLGVVIATGGFESDIALTEMIEDLPGYRSVYPAGLKGDGLKLGTGAGGAITIIRNNLAVLLGYETPETGVVTVAANRELVAPHGLIVNAAGRRFGNEASFQDLAGALRSFDGRTRRHCNLPCWLIFDSDFAEAGTLQASANGIVPDWIARAQSLSALADLIGIDAEGLEDTARRFNGFADAGTDADFGRGERVWSLAPIRGTGKNPSLGRVENGPFYALPLKPTIIGASGLRASADAQVLGWSGEGLAGLYAIGNAAAHDEYGVGYQAGQSLASAMIFALLAVEHAVASATVERSAS